MYYVIENGNTILEIRTLGETEARKILSVLHAFGRMSCGLWENTTCIVKPVNKERKTKVA